MSSRLASPPSSPNTSPAPMPAPSPTRSSATAPPPPSQQLSRPCMSGWAMLDCYPRRWNGGDSLGDSLVAEGYTSGGERVRFALRASPPPRFSRLYFDWVSGPELDRRGPKVVAVHRGSILLCLAFGTTGWAVDFREDYFVYQLPHPRSTTAAQLTRLPSDGCGAPVLPCEIGILCSHDGSEFVVAHLELLDDHHEQEEGPVTVTASLCLLKDGSWVQTTLPVRHDEGRGQDLRYWETDHVLPCGDHLCWVDLLRGILLCDVFSPDPDLRYVPLPVDPHNGVSPPDTGYRGAVGAFRSVCATTEGVIKFVDIAHPACWYPTTLKTSSSPSSPPFIICSWIWNDGKRKWVDEGTLDAEGFWALTDSARLPRAKPIFPLVDMKDPQTTYFVLREEFALGCDEEENASSGEDKTSSLVAIHMPRSTMDSPSSFVQRISLLPNAPEATSSSWGYGGSSSSQDAGCDSDCDTASCNLSGYEPFLSCEVPRCA